MTDEHGVWAYAITDYSGGDLSPLTGVAGARVRAAAAGGLTVLVSDVDLAEFGEAALRRNLENLAWLEEVARAHHQVIDAAARLFPLLPARLATVYSSDAAMAAILSARAGHLHAALRRVGGREEWGVKAYPAPDNDRCERVPAQRMETGGRQAGGGAGLAYLKRRRAELTARQESRGSAVAGAQAVHSELSGHAAQARLHPPQSAQLSGVRATMLLNAAYLLDPSGASGFTTAVAAAATAHPELRLELTGPWPPYSFTGEDS
jgi:Gas vesicle synthesis protein GvpL/GvpF